MTSYKRYTITSALPYANGPLHIGHIAGAYLPADIYVRYLKSRGRDVVFICGSDEHGAAITIQAKKEDTTPRAIVDKYHEINKRAFKDFGIDFDMYHRTSEPLHHETAQEYFNELLQKGCFEEKTSQQYYDATFNQFLADRYIKGTCPKCGYDSAYGDQCENCGSSLSPTDLINPVSTLSGNTPELKETKHWYLKLDEANDWLKDWIETGQLNGEQQHDPKEWKKHVIGQCLSWLNDGLQPRAITRDLDWGVKVPLEGTDGKVLYVWLDAPMGYISATKQWAADTGKDWQTYWKDKDTKLVHFIGKDNIVFHAIIFPAILNSLEGFILPDNVPANEFMNLEGDKISTSRNWAIWLHEYLEDIPGKQDELRYVLTALSPETKDSEFTWKDYKEKVNNELVAKLGNFVNRVMVLTNKFFDGKIDQANVAIDNVDQLKQINELVEKMEDSLERYRFKEAQQFLMQAASVGDEFLAFFEPWKLIKSDVDKTKEVLYVGQQIVAKLAILSRPFLPSASCKMFDLLNLDGSQFNWDSLKDNKLVPLDHQVNKAAHLFQKIEDSVIEKQVEKLNSKSKTGAAKAVEAPPQKDEISFDDFMKLDIRTATITTAERVPKADKLLQLSVDLGYEQRTVVSGIAEHYNPEEIVGKQVSMITNLAPRKIRGVLSNGMILMAEDDNGNLKFVSPEAKMENGSVVR